MKTKLLFLFVAIAVVAACKKNRVCNCTVTTSGTTETRTSSTLLGIDTTVTTPLNTSNQNKSTYSKVTKKKASYNCFNRTDDVKETTSNGIPGIMDITVTNNGLRVYDCKLE